MKQELKLHLLPLLVLFLLISFIWSIQSVHWPNYLFLFFGLLSGSFLLDIDHLIYWLYLRPNLDESKLAQTAWRQGDFRSLLKLLETTHQGHTNLIFHHFFFQVVLTVTSFFIFSSSSSVLVKSLTLAVNIHLLTDEIKDFFQNPTHLQTWLFARETKQLSLPSIRYYLVFFSFLCLILIFMLINSAT